MKKNYLLSILLAFFIVALTNAQIKVGYVTMFDNITGEGAADPIVAMLEADPNVDLTVIETDANDTDGPLDLTGFDVVVAQEAFGSSSTIYKRGQTLGMGTIPVPFILNKVYTMRDGRGFTDGATGSGGEVEGTLYISVDPANQGNDLFKGITFDGDSVQLFNTGGDDNGGDTRTKGMQYATDVKIESAASTLLASGINDPANATVCINDLAAGDSIGSEELQARMITMAMNYGAVCKKGDLTDAGLTLWRNAIYSLGGIPIPDAPAVVVRSVAYVTMFDNITGEGAADPIIAMLEADPNIDLTVIETDANDTDGPIDLSGYDAVVAQEAFGSSSTIYKRGQSLGMGTIPVPFILNKVYTMRDGRGFTDGATGSGGEVEGTLHISVDPANQGNDLFKGITFDGDSVQLFNTGGDDNGGDTRTKGMQYATDVKIESAASTLLASGINDPANATVCINDLAAGDSIGSEELQARMITMAMNYGAICKKGDLTDAGLTLWRNAIYSLTGLPIPDAQVIAPRSVAYVTMFSGITAEGAADPIIAMLEADPNIDLTVIETDANDTDGPIDLTGYSAVVAQEAFGSSSTIYKRGQSLGMGTIPVPFILNKVYTMRDGRGFTDGATGSGGEVEGTLHISVDPANQGNDLFKGITFDGDSVQLFNTGGDDNGGDTRTKGMQYATDVKIESAASTLLASGINDPANATVCINDLAAGDSIGSEELQARMITMAMNYGAICKKGDLTDAGLTLWRNAVYSLAGIPVPNEKVEGPRSVAYVTMFSGITGENAEDPIVKYLESDPKIDLTVIETDANDTGGPLDLSGYDAVVAQEAFGSSSTIYKRGQTLGMGTIPVPFILNKVYTMRDGRGFTDGATGSGGEVEGTLHISIDPANQGNELFNGIVLDGDSVKIFRTGGDDNGGDTRTKGMQYATDVKIESAASTLLASGINDPANATVCINDLAAGDSIGSEELQARMITMAMNYGALCKENDLTVAGLTLWRNAIYSLTGLAVPATPAVIIEPEKSFDRDVMLFTSLNDFDNPKDSLQIAWLQSEGYTVDVITESVDFYNVSETFMDSINNSGVIIFGRAPSSGSLNSGSGYSLMSEVTRPVIMNGPYAARNGGWFANKGPVHYQESDAPGKVLDTLKATVLVPGDDVFKGVTLMGDSVPWVHTPEDVFIFDTMTNGEVIAVAYDLALKSSGVADSVILFERWVTGQTLFEGVSAQTGRVSDVAAAPRTYFGMGNDKQPHDSLFFTLTPDAKIVYKAEIDRLINADYVAQPSVLAKNSNIGTITADVGTITPAVSAGVTEYMVTGIPDGTTQIILTATPEDANASVLDGSGFDNIDTLLIEAGTGQSKFTVTAEDKIGTTQYTINVLPNDADLTDITLSTGTLDPTFASDVYSYTVDGTTIDADDVTVTGTKSDSGADLVYAPSQSVNVADGQAIVTLTVTAQDGLTENVYTVLIEQRVGIVDITEAGIEMYPNPANATLTLKGLDINTNVTIINAAGQMVLNTVATQEVIDLNISNFEQGLYMVKLEIEGNVYTSRFIKQ